MHIAFAPSSGQKVSRTIVSWGLSTLMEAQVGLSDNRGMLRLGRRAAGKVWTPQAEREGESMVLSGPMLEGPQQELQDGGSQSYAEGWESCGAGRVGQSPLSFPFQSPSTSHWPDPHGIPVSQQKSPGEVAQRDQPLKAGAGQRTVEMDEERRGRWVKTSTGGRNLGTLLSRTH